MALVDYKKQCNLHTPHRCACCKVPIPAGKEQFVRNNKPVRQMHMSMGSPAIFMRLGGKVFCSDHALPQE